MVEIDILYAHVLSCYGRIRYFKCLHYNCVAIIMLILACNAFFFVCCSPFLSIKSTCNVVYS